MTKLPWTHVKRLLRSDGYAPLQAWRDCPLCDTRDEMELVSIKDFQFFTDQAGHNRADHRVVSCNSCGLLYTNPCYTPKGFQVLFEKAGRSYGHSAGRISEQTAWLNRRFPKMRSLMDVGCGAGDLLKALPMHIARFGIDIDEQTLKRATLDAPHVSFSLCDFASLTSLPQVDVITMFHVLEHLPDPGGVLWQLRTCTRDGVSLVIEVPIVERAADLQDRDIVGFFTVQHLTHFSAERLSRLLARNGWRVCHAEAMKGYNGWRVIAEHGPFQTDVGYDPGGTMAAQLYLKVWRRNVLHAQERIERLREMPQIMLWGAGQHTEYLALLTNLFAFETSFVLVDSDPLKQGQFYHSLPVLAPSQIPEREWRHGMFPIVISTYGGQESVRKILERMGVVEERILTFYDITPQY